MKIFNNRIYFNTFFKKGVKTITDDWGVYYVTGYQGSGKNYFATFMSNLLTYQKVKTMSKVWFYQTKRWNILLK